MPSTWLRNDWRPRREIDLNVPAATAIAVFALGTDNGRGGYYVDLVARSPADAGALRRSLHALDGDHLECTAFKWDEFTDEAAAFAVECRIFHTFAPVLNDEHPRPPAGSGLRCRECDLVEQASDACAFDRGR